MKQIISIISGIIAAILIFWGMGSLINLVTSDIEDHNIRGIARVICWLFSIGFTIWLSVIVGSFVGVIVQTILEHKRRRF